MSNIDKEFFQDIYKNKPTLSEEILNKNNNINNYTNNTNNNNTNNNNINTNSNTNNNIISSDLNIQQLQNFHKKELIYEFSIYHPTKNIKTQQVCVLGSCFLSQLKDNIYCVLDEIHNGQSGSFFFIENTFYIDFRFKDSKSLSR